MASNRGRGAASRHSLRRRIVLAVVASLLVAALVGTLALGGRDESATTTTTTEPAELSGAALELADLLETRQAQQYHARYEGRSGESTVVIETWQDGRGTVRQDQILSAGAEGAHLASFDGADGSIRCTQLSEAEWSCRQAAPGETAQADPIAAIRARLAEGKVTVQASQIDGDPARCFRLAAAGGDSELCVRPDTGIPVRITGGQTTLRAVVVEPDVDPAVFEPPGPVTG